MTSDLSIKISAYLDAEMTAAEMVEFERELETNQALSAEFQEQLMADAAAAEAFDAQLTTPVPLELVREIRNAPLEPRAANATHAPRFWGAWVAGVLLFVLGGVGGYLAKAPTEIQTATWLDYIADYHAVYASQKRHLVEVGAEEADHLQAWLGKSVGTQFTVPDLTEFGLTFEGGRLLVAEGQPVAQLMYTQADGAVIALCFQEDDSPASTPGTFNRRDINGFDFVSWRSAGSRFVVVGPDGQDNLGQIAQAASTLL